MNMRPYNMSKSTRKGKPPFRLPQERRVPRGYRARGMVEAIS